jgi:hypothetical protein
MRSYNDIELYQIYHDICHQETLSKNDSLAI